MDKSLDEGMDRGSAGRPPNRRAQSRLRHRLLHSKSRERSANPEVPELKVPSVAPGPAVWASLGARQVPAPNYHSELESALIQ